MLFQNAIKPDDNRLLQVFANLISNAIKYSPAEGTVDISIQAQAGYWRIGVRDYGQGIPEDFKQKMFQRFAQADSSDTREKGGTGLGLSIAKAIVERHRGEINFFSEELAVACILFLLLCLFFWRIRPF